ncbi:hypothetical protein HPB50_025020 [Hyalomma asiaticum]|uniref:Uncharacterized protein n=1 Tax=Hyalomma asiaticum TaxID=266040 RepID=A0ACB7T8Z1_HYAAI|nr:hypothetical protein HPB50_025020 [Hyalomma asiaticum]
MPAADNIASDFTQAPRDPALPESEEPKELLHPVTSFRNITRMYQEERRRLPEAHPKLTRQQQTTLRRAQAGSLAHPVVINPMYPVEHDTFCPFCKREKGTMLHILAEGTQLKTPFPSTQHSQFPVPLAMGYLVIQHRPTDSACTDGQGPGVARNIWAA